jgi:electron transfer flavoprotein beta subunit
MKIIVLIKQVPDTTEVRLDRKTGNLIREGVPSIINPDDRMALECALRLKERHEARITVLTMGPPQAIDALSEALGMGADAGILLTDRAFAGADTWATSTTLSRALTRIGACDLILCGRQAIDGDTAQTGPQIAECLGLPQLTRVNEIEEISEKRITVSRRTETGSERLAADLPALLTITKVAPPIRYPRVANLLQACSEKAPIEIWNAADIGCKTAEVGLSGSLTQVIKTFSPKTRREGEILAGEIPEAVTALVARLKQHHLV